MGSKRASASRVTQLSVAERVARGKAARKSVARSSHALFEPGAHRVDPVKLLERQAETRVPELVPIRYGRMLMSPFTFYSWEPVSCAGLAKGTRPRLRSRTTSRRRLVARLCSSTMLAGRASLGLASTRSVRRARRWRRRVGLPAPRSLRQGGTERQPRGRPPRRRGGVRRGIPPRRRTLRRRLAHGGVHQRTARGTLLVFPPLGAS
jgi:hypothetical protein